MTAEITVCLLSWMRPHNIPRVLDSIAAQSVATAVFLWDNGETRIEDPRIDWMVRSSTNRGCWPRWLMAVEASTPLICTLDDDICFADPHVLRDGIEAAARLEPDQLVGPFGRRLAPDGAYATGTNVRGDEVDDSADQPADIVKGRHIVARTDTLRRLLPPSIAPSTEDDIAVSGLLAHGRRGRHRRPHIYGHRADRFVELPAEHATWKSPEHLGRRDAAARHFFNASA